MRSTLFWISLAVGVSSMMAIAPNLLWLARSSAMVRNASAEELALRIIVTDETVQHIVMVLAPGGLEFLWIDPEGEATLTVEANDGTNWRSYCSEYVEDGMYRVEITVRARAPACVRPRCGGLSGRPRVASGARRMRPVRDASRHRRGRGIG